MFVETRYEHVVLDDDGTPIIAGTTMKVRELVAERFAWGWSPEELLVNHPYLTPGQIFSALAYHADNEEEISRSIVADIEYVYKVRRTAKQPPLLARLGLSGKTR